VALANDLWRIQRKPAKAREILAVGRALNAKPVQPLLELVRLEVFEGNYPAARDAGRTAMSLASDPLEISDTRTRFAWAVCDEITRASLRSGGARTSAQSDAFAREAFELLETIVRDEPGLRQPSRSQVLLALLVGNGPSALRAWQS
jgi:hypothetical protein